MKSCEILNNTYGALRRRQDEQLQVSTNQWEKRQYKASLESFAQFIAPHPIASLGALISRPFDKNVEGRSVNTLRVRGVFALPVPFAIALAINLAAGAFQFVK